MSGHSKWSSIKHQKASSDAKRSNLFTKLANAISVAARASGDPTMNFQLRLACDKARSANMPKDGIERAIKRGTRELGGQKIENIVYEAYGPNGVAILIEAATDNKNRALSAVKAVISRFGGKLAGEGAVSYLFERKGLIKATASQDVDEAELKIIDSGADDYESSDGTYLIYTKPEETRSVREKLETAGLAVQSAELTYEPQNLVTIPDNEAEKVINLLKALDDLDDVTSVSSNLG